jgi:hypothetical protein
MVGLAFTGLAEATQAYNGIQVNPNAPFSNLPEVKAAFDKVETNYLELNGALPSIKTQGELGEGAPDLGKLREFVAAMGPWIQTRKDYYTALEACAPITASRQPTECDVSVFDQYEKPMVDSIQPVATSWESVVASIPKAGQ